jgi:hypothetical protein
MDMLENQIKRALDEYSKGNPVGQWMQSITGIGPVISAGYLAHIDIEKAPTAGHIWSFAGLNPKQEWGKGQKRPWNARLKVLAYKTGESFVKFQNHKDDFYGKYFAARREYEQQQNALGKYADEAAEILRIKKIGKDTSAYQAYSQGKLPDAHIHSRARRYAVKLFISHLHEVWFTIHFGEQPPKPYILTQEGHVHYIPPPNWP